MEAFFALVVLTVLRLVIPVGVVLALGTLADRRGLIRA